MITDEYISDKSAAILEAAGVKLIVARLGSGQAARMAAS